jgi:hypothetical protein
MTLAERTQILSALSQVIGSFAFSGHSVKIEPGQIIVLLRESILYDEPITKKEFTISIKRFASAMMVVRDILSNMAVARLSSTSPPALDTPKSSKPKV